MFLAIQYLLTFSRRHLLTLMANASGRNCRKDRNCKTIRFAAPEYDYLPGELAKKGYMMAILD